MDLEQGDWLVPSLAPGHAHMLTYISQVLSLDDHDSKCTPRSTREQGSDDHDAGFPTTGARAQAALVKQPERALLLYLLIPTQTTSTLSSHTCSLRHTPATPTALTI